MSYLIGTENDQKWYDVLWNDQMTNLEICRKILKTTIFKSSLRLNPFKLRAWNDFYIIIWLLFDERKHFSNNIQNYYEKNSNFYLSQFQIPILRLILTQRKFSLNMVNSHVTS